MNSEEPRVAIIILNWNGLEDTIECLESLKKVTYPNYEVILVDNGSEGNDVRILSERFGDYVHVIENDRNYGFAEGNNIGMRHALERFDPDHVLLLNNDTVVAPDFLTELVNVAENDPQIGIVGPKIYFYHESNKIQSAGAQINWWTGQTSLVGCFEMDRGQFEDIRDVDWVSGCALLIRHKTTKDIGLLCAAYFTYFEETDWCARCRKAGYRVVYAPAAKIWHKRELGAGKVDSLSLYYATRNRFLFMKRNSTRLQLVVFFVNFFLMDVLSPLSLSIRQRDPKLLLGYFKGAYKGIGLTVRGQAEGAGQELPVA